MGRCVSNISICYCCLCALTIGGVSNLSYKWLSYGSYLFTGITGVVFFSAITRFSRVWFPAEQRATSTGLLCTFANLGGILPAIIGPLIVTEPSDNESGLDKNGRAIIKKEITSYLLVCRYKPMNKNNYLYKAKFDKYSLITSYF